MRSPVAVAFRGLIMLLFMVAIPVIALFWKSIPGYVDKLVVICEEHNIAVPRFLARAAVDPAAAGRDELFEAPIFAPHNAGSATNAPHQLPGGALVATPPMPLDAPPMGATADLAFAAPGGAPAGTAPIGNGVRQASHEAPRSLDQLSRQTGVAMAAEQPTATTERFTAIQQRLRALGATYYLLESFGADGAGFRFHCKMAIAGNSRYTRHFEATDTDPLRAMARVLEAVETARRSSALKGLLPAPSAAGLLRAILGRKRPFEDLPNAPP